MKRAILVRIGFFLVLALYPAVVYFGIRFLPVSFLAVLLALILLARSTAMSPSERRLMLPLILVHVAYSVVTAVSGNQSLLLWYPALVNLSLCAVFALSLRQDQSILLRWVRARNIRISVYAPAYLNRLTAVWSVFFFLNGVAAVLTSMISMKAWALYNGLVAYLLVGALIGGELFFRAWYKRSKGV
jgi:uncharacterized membrane protein